MQIPFFILATCLLISTPAGLYKSLNPAKSTEQFLFYDLYKGTNEAQQALENGWKVISDKPLDERLFQDPAFLQLVDKMHRPHTVSEETSPLSAQSLAILEKSLKPLATATLKGHNASSEEEVLACDGNEIDVSHALLLALHVDEAKRRTYEHMLDMMALEIQAKLPLKASDEEKVQVINHYLFFDIGFRFPPQLNHEKNEELFTDIPNVLESKRGVCLGVALIYYSLAQRLNLPLIIYTPPGHIFLAHEQRTIEPTARGVNIPLSEYLSIEIASVRKRTSKELVAMMLMNSAASHLEKSSWKEAEKLYEAAYKYMPQDAHLNTLYGELLYLLGDSRATEHLETALKYPDEELLVPNVLAVDLLKKRIRKEDLAYFFTGYEKTKKGRLEKCEALQGVLKRNPEFRSTYGYLGALEFELLHPNQTVFYLEKLSEIDNENLECEYSLAALFHERFNDMKALEHLDRCEKILKQKGATSPFITELTIELAPWR